MRPREWLYFMVCLIVLAVVITAMTLGTLFLAEGDCIFQSNAHKARCR